MSHSPFIKFLSLVLAWTLFTPILTVRASEASVPISVDLENSLQFLDPDGQEVLVPSGNYTIQAGSDHLILHSEDRAAITLDSTEGVHSLDVPFPMVMTNSGEDADLPHSHLLTVLFPDGRTLQAIGDDPQITTRSIPKGSEGNTNLLDPSILTLDHPVYFMAPDGSPLIVQAGTYTAEAAFPWIRLIPGQDRKNALLIVAKQDTHDSDITDLLALSLPGGIVHELDVHQVMLLLPTGQSLEATGSYSGIQKRGFKFKKKKKYKKRKKFNKYVKKTVKRNYQTAKKRSQQRQQTRKRVLAKAGRTIQNAAKKTMKGIKFFANNPKFASCKAALVSAKKTAGAASQAMKQLEKYMKNPEFIKKLQASAESFVRSKGGVIQAMLESGRIIGSERNRPLFESLTDPDHTCKQSFKTTVTEVTHQIGPQLAAMGSDSNSEVRSRSARQYHLVGATVGGQFALAKIGGGEFGAGIGLGFDGSKKKYVFGGGWVGTDAGVAGALQIGYWATIADPNAFENQDKVKGLAGWYLGFGLASRDIGNFLMGTASGWKLPIEIGIDFFWSPEELWRLVKGKPTIGWPTGVVVSFIKGASFKSGVDKVPWLKVIPTVSGQAGYTGLW